MTSKDISELGTILAVWAHPDDEAFVTGGTMVMSTRLGNRVVCVTATKGEAGVQDESKWPADRLADIRDKEMMESLQVMGVTEHHWLGYRDGGCGEVPMEEGVARVRAFIESVRPDTVITFGPEGMTGHVDHKAVSAWTTEAFKQSAPTGARLLYPVQTQDWVDRYLPMIQRFNVFPTGRPPVMDISEPGYHFELDDQLADVKFEALMKHASQLEMMVNELGEDYLKQSNRVELFRLARTK